VARCVADEMIREPLLDDASGLYLMTSAVTLLLMTYVVKFAHGQIETKHRSPEGLMPGKAPPSGWRASGASFWMPGWSCSARWAIAPPACGRCASRRGLIDRYFYKNFHDTEDLLAAVYSESMDQVQAAVMKAIAESPGAEQPAT
jgi:hypothetical protein